MPQSLATGRSPFWPPSFVRSNAGDLFISNGIDEILRWNGTDATAHSAGIAAPATGVTVGSSGSGSITGTYYAYVRYGDADGNFSSLSPISSVHSPSSKAQIDYTNVPVSSESRVTKRQIFRNTNGQTTTFYLDTEISDNSTTTGSSTKTDTQLQASTELPILNPDGTVNANRFGEPPDHKAYIANHQDRLWFAGDVTYNQGSVQVTNGSSTVTGRGTAWTSSMADREFYVVGDSDRYVISSVNVGAQTLALTENYGGTTDLFALYAIRPDRDERQKVYFSEAGEPESVQSTNSFKIQEPDDADDVTGLMALGHFLFVLMNRHIYRINFAYDPTEDVSVHPVVFRGSLNNRTWVRVEDKAYMMDREGIHRFEGAHNGGVTVHISEPIQDYFRNNRINWRASRWFFASHSPGEEVVRFHVALGGQYLPKHALCYHYRHEAWWVESFPFQLGAACLAFIGNGQGNVLGSEFETIYAQGHGTADGVYNYSLNNTLRGTATASSLYSLTDSAASFPSTGLVNAPLAIVEGRGKGQVRRVTSVSGTTRLYIKTPWAIKPDTTSKYQLGAVPWVIKTGRYRFIDRDRYPVDEYNTRRAVLVAEPTENEAQVDIQTYLNHETVPNTNLVTLGTDCGVFTSGGQYVIDITHDPNNDGVFFSGYRHIEFSGTIIDPRFSDNWMILNLSGFQALDRVIVHEVTIDGVV